MGSCSKSNTPYWIKGTALFMCLFFLTFKMHAQDIQFSQFYANVLYLNPAFAGSAHQSRAIFHQRLQWPGLDAKYITTTFSFDHYFDNARSGLGVMVLRDVQGSNTISTTEISAQYSYELLLSSKYAFRAGLQGTYASRYINYSFLKFPDQYTVDGPTGQGTQEPFGYDKVHYPDVSAGGILYSDRIWIGFSFYHLNTPNQSFYGDASNLPVKTSIVGGYKFILQGGNRISKKTGDHEVYVTPTFQFKSQGKSDQLDLGIYGLYHQTMLGFWYRGIPVKHYQAGLQNHESIVFLLGWKTGPWSFGYSFDFTVSKLNIGRTGGSHELNITYLFDWPAKKRKPMRRIPCPNFNR